MADLITVEQQFADQAEACAELGSPFTAMLCRVLPAHLDLRTRFGRRILEWPGDPAADNVALRAAGALHALARSGWEPNLTSVYPPDAATEQMLWVAIADALQHHDSFLTERLSSPPQTNEVARSATILGALLSIAGRTGQPIALYEIGASAGLNLGLDRYRYRLGEQRVWGEPDSPLAIDSDWRGNPPALNLPLRIVSRQGCDLKPIDPGNAEDRTRLLSYIWADQTHRLQRIELALALAARDGRKVERNDAAFWLERQFSAPPAPGIARVLFHTIVWQYLPEESKARIETLLATLGAAATKDTPLARFSFEADGEQPNARLDLTMWPGGETVTLGRGDFHGRWAEWA